MCAKCKVLFDTITVYDEHLENCKNSAENYNFDEVLEKLANASQQQLNNGNNKDMMRATSTTSSTAAANAQQSTASIIVVTAAMASSTTSTSTQNVLAGGNRPTTVGTTVTGIVTNGLPISAVSTSNAASLATMSNVTGLATISMPATNFKIIKYPRHGNQTF